MGEREKREGRREKMFKKFYRYNGRQLYVQMGLCISWKEIVTRTDHVGK